MNNRYEPIDGKYEYKRIPLKGLESKYIYVPLSVITDTELDIRRIGVFSYLRTRCGLDDTIGFTIPDIVEWCGGKPDRYKNGSNDKTLLAMDGLSDRGYLTYLTNKSRSSFMKCQFNMDYYFENCSDGYAVVYLDELKKIMDYKKDNLKDSTINNVTILLVFSLIRHKVRRRPNELKPEERYSDEIKNRKERLPEAYSDNVINLANEIGISSKTFSKIIDILEYELCLIVTDRAYRVKNENNEFRTLHTIFSNAYKREDRYLLVTGDNYSREEIKLKAESMKNYKIDKRKRRPKGGE